MSKTMYKNDVIELIKNAKANNEELLFTSVERNTREAATQYFRCPEKYVKDTGVYYGEDFEFDGFEIFEDDLIYTRSYDKEGLN
ncbi:hypothetical protein ACY3DP_000963 [Listeria monocytogenes]|uniref:hypothetical protein n=1 Tax=Listeria monocytogenes TaxID=1639 RepID=UPI0010E32E29|nr:hypothetical protein [Listeria monocytogenes]EAC9890509.1 hypothetical protein [Listeria monocytogenes]ECQ6574661.1 hypothetical protein [Listeria monocytogenes]EIZ2412659.1 hypothetical protein [Listeria monocytogenes]EJV0591005.1 hypothetical protein [Listeria monocytogenes]EJV0593975.1 hypothetical protein [Listeria monocytogenes]